MKHNALPPSVMLVMREATEGASLAARLDRTGAVHTVGSVTERADLMTLCLRRAPRVLLLDLGRGDALAILDDLRQSWPHPVVGLSHTNEQAARAMEHGAVEAVPFTSSDKQIAEIAVLMSQVKVIRRIAARPPRELGPRRIALLCASTGGPLALRAVLSQLPEQFSLPIVVVQHMPVGFAPTLAEWMSSDLPLKVVVAERGVNPLPGTIYIAPDSHHTEIGPGDVFMLSPANGVEAAPSADRLLLSAAQTYGPRAFGAVMTGMGRDGAEGLLALRRAGGTVVVQDQETSAIFGMPGAALEIGAASESMSPERIGQRLATWGAAIAL